VSGRRAAGSGRGAVVEQYAEHSRQRGGALLTQCVGTVDGEEPAGSGGSAAGRAAQRRVRRGGERGAATSGPARAEESQVGCVWSSYIIVREGRRTRGAGAPVNA
jgi:hypothetical protein